MEQSKDISEPGAFKVVEEGTEYKIPAFAVEDGKGLVCVGFNTIHFVRGSKLANEKVEKRVGCTHESLLEMMIHDLQFKNNLVPSRETSQTITKLEEALLWQQRRGQNRAKEGKQGTYKK